MTIETSRAAVAINAELPQHQCQRCGYPSCQEFAEAVSIGSAPGNRCDPGGIRVLTLLNSITGQNHHGLDPGFDSPALPTGVRIHESECIGCTLCLQACPVAAIIGAGKLMHTVIPADCTGCELCLPVCPVDCIKSIDFQEKNASLYQESLTAQSSHHRLNYERWQRRTQSASLEKEGSSATLRRDEIAESVARVRLKRIVLNQERLQGERDTTQ